MKLEYSSYFLNFRHPFKLSTGMRLGTDCVYVKISTDNYSGFGEATLPPYLKETKDSVIDFLQRIDLSSFSLDHTIVEIRQFIAENSNNSFALCAIEEALVDLYRNAGKNINGFSLQSYKTNTTYTIGVSIPNELSEKIKSAENFSHLKLKFDEHCDKDYFLAIKNLSDKAICIDLNQAWEHKSMKECVSLGNFLQEQNVIFLEQPFGKENLKKTLEFKSKCSIPVIADESVQNIDDLNFALDIFDGVNVKLLKCGGPINALQMINCIKEKNKLVVIGCMSESTCGVYHAASIAQSADYIDLDGPYLINNDPFSGFSILNSQVILDPLKIESNLTFMHNQL